MERDDKIPGERSSRSQAPQRGKSQVHSESSEEDTDAKGRGVPDVTGKRVRCARPSGVPRGPATSTGSLASLGAELELRRSGSSLGPSQ